MQLSPAIFDLLNFIYCTIGQLICKYNIWAFLTGSQCRVSDSQVTIKAHGSLVCSNLGIFNNHFTTTSWFYGNFGNHFLVLLYLKTTSWFYGTNNNHYMFYGILWYGFIGLWGLLINDSSHNLHTVGYKLDSSLWQSSFFFIINCNRFLMYNI